MSGENRPKRVDVVVGVLSRDGELLLGQRMPDALYPLKWEFPGGKVEPGETPEQALARELLEELGIVARVGSLLYETEAHYGESGFFRVRYFDIENHSGEIVNNVFRELQWVGPEGLAKVDILDGNREFCSRLSTGEILTPGLDSKDRNAPEPHR